MLISDVKTFISNDSQNSFVEFDKLVMNFSGLEEEFESSVLNKRR